MSVVLAVPFVGIVLGFLLGLYSIILSIIGMNAVNQFGWGKATAAVVVIPIMITGLTACGAILILTIWGQEIGDAFPDIIRALETPVSTGA